MKVWITKYALTAGISEAEARLCSANNDMVEVVKSGVSTYYHGEGREWHRTKEQALAQAEQMRVDKIASLEKQIDRLRKLTWKQF